MLTFRLMTETNQRPLEAGIAVDLKPGGSYGDYLRLDLILNAQEPRSGGQHDEMLFIIQHQTSELWMKLFLHELDLATQLVREDRLQESFKAFSRIAQIQRVLLEQWAVLETMTPADYMQFRDTLGQSSGFQSFQYRAIEFGLGNKDANALLPHRSAPDTHAWLSARLVAPSLYDEFLRHLARRGFVIPRDKLQRDFTQPYENDARVLAVIAEIYANTSAHWEAYDLCEKLVDIEGRFQNWRFRHMTTVKRIIGFRPGTGGSSGVGFLQQALNLTFFPELWDVRTAVGKG